MIPATVGPVRYDPRYEPVAITIFTPFGTHTMQTTQAALTARAVVRLETEGATWDDPDVKGMAQDYLTDLYPDAGFIVS